MFKMNTWLFRRFVCSQEKTYNAQQTWKEKEKNKEKENLQRNSKNVT